MESARRKRERRRRGEERRAPARSSPSRTDAGDDPQVAYAPMPGQVRPVVAAGHARKKQ